MRRHSSFRRLLLMTSLSMMTSLAMMTSPCRAAALEDGETAARVSSCCTDPLKPGEDKDFACDACLELVLRRGDIPAGVTTISLSNIASLTIGEGAFYHLPGLRHLHLRDIGNVTVESGGLRLPQKSTWVVFTAAYIGTIQLSEDALTGYWRNKSVVTLQDINKLDIASNGLSYQSSGHGPNVQFTNIHVLELAPGAFNARINVLRLRNISMRECQRGTFTSQIDYVGMYNVTMSDVPPLCFNDVGKFGVCPHRGVSVSSSTLGLVRPQAFYGKTPCSEENEQPKSGNKLSNYVIDDNNSERSGKHNDRAPHDPTAHSVVSGRKSGHNAFDVDLRIFIRLGYRSIENCPVHAKMMLISHRAGRFDHSNGVKLTLLSRLQ